MSAEQTPASEAQGEKKPLLADNQPSQLRLAYSMDSHVVLEKGLDGGLKVIDYEPLKLSSYRVLTSHIGTVLENPVLLVEQFFITALFFLAATPSYILFNQKAAENRHGGVTINEWLDTQEDKMRAFAMIMTQLAAFLLTFYTSICVTRWWVIRTQGVGGIKKAAVELEMFISQHVTRDVEVLSAIRRYARASLILIVLWRRKQLSSMKEQLVGRGILLQNEADQLEEWNHCLHETIWAWQSGIVAKLHNEGKIKSEPLLCLLLDRCSEGRTAVQCIHTHLAVRVPMQYVHLLGLLVKLHNTVLAVIMGILFGAAVRDGRTIICIQLFCRTLILPVMFNAILLINCELSDPFDGAITAFPTSKYEKALEKDAQSVLDAYDNLPQWMQDRFKAAEP